MTFCGVGLSAEFPRWNYCVTTTKTPMWDRPRVRLARAGNSRPEGGSGRRYAVILLAETEIDAAPPTGELTDRRTRANRDGKHLQNRMCARGCSRGGATFSSRLRTCMAR